MACSVNWANGASLAKAVVHIMKVTCFLCMLRSNLISGQRKMSGEEYGYVNNQ